MGKKLTHEEFENRVHKTRPNIIFTTKYVNAKTKIECHCSTCGNDWITSPDSLNQGCGCPKCASKKSSERQAKTHEQFIQELYEVNPNIEIQSQYINARTKIHCKCLVDGFEWDATPDNLLRGTGCPVCSGTYLNKDILSNRLKIISPEITIVGDYINNTTPILCYCNKHNEYFTSSPSSLSKGQIGCKKCQYEKASDSAKYTQEQFEDKFYDYFGDEYIVIDKYIDAKTSIKIKCIKCDTEFSIIPNNAFSRGINCPTCHKSRSMPKGEERIFDYLSKNNIIFIHGHEFDDLFGVNDGHLSYDFYLPTENLLIEYNGEQHYRSVEYFGGEEKFKIQQEHDLRKYNYANLHNYNLLIIPYTQYGNIKEILSSTIKIAA